MWVLHVFFESIIIIFVIPSDSLRIQFVSNAEMGEEKQNRSGHQNTFAFCSMEVFLISLVSVSRKSKCFIDFVFCQDSSMQHQLIWCTPSLKIIAKYKLLFILAKFSNSFCFVNTAIFIMKNLHRDIWNFPILCSLGL